MKELPVGITQGLVVDEPWVSKILTGQKTWEMRSSPTNKSGRFALIKKGSGQIWGFFSLIESSGPYTSQQLKDSFFYHQIPDNVLDDPNYKWNYAWVLKDVVKLEEPIPYKHPNGAVIWVNLQDSHENTRKTTINQPIFRAQTNKKQNNSVQSTENLYQGKVPMAKDGTFFDRELCLRAGRYTVGEKGNEQKFSNYEEALMFLTSMKTAKWRRPNSNGNWGIVSAAKWIQPKK